MFKVVEIIFGGRMPSRHETLDEAVQTLYGATEGELYEVKALAKHEEKLVKLADVMLGEWYLTAEGKRRDIMARVKAEKTKADSDDLIGGEDKTSKRTAKKKAAATDSTNGKQRGRAPAFSDNQVIQVLKEPSFRKDSASGKAFQLIKKAGTVGKYRKLREKAGLTGLGGVLRNLVESKHVRVG